MLEITFVSYFHEHVKNLFQRIHIILQVEMNFRYVHEVKILMTQLEIELQSITYQYKY